MNIHIDIKTRLRSYRIQALIIMVEEKASAIKDLTIVPDLTFGSVESYVKSVSQSLGNKELSKGYKYFCEKYVTNITGK